MKRQTPRRGPTVEERIVAWDAQNEYAARTYLADPERYPFGQDFALAVLRRLGLLVLEREGDVQ